MIKFSSLHNANTNDDNKSPQNHITEKDQKEDYGTMELNSNSDHHNKSSTSTKSHFLRKLKLSKLFQVIRFILYYNFTLLSTSSLSINFIFIWIFMHVN